MNNKYDTKQFAKLMEEIQLMSEKVFEEDKDDDASYRVKEKLNGDVLRQSIVDQNFLSYQVQFDQVGEFKFQEWESPSIYSTNTSSVDPVRMKLEEEVDDIITLCWNDEVHFI